MAQDNSEIGKVKRMLDSVSLPANDPVINFIRSRDTSTSSQKYDPAAAARFREITAGVQERAATAAANNELTNRISEGDTNLFGATIRMLTGLGRGILNGAYDVMEETNKTVARLRDGQITGEDFLDTAKTIATTPFTFTRGAVRGVAGSAPGLEGAVQKATGRPVLDGWYELLKSPEFEKSVQNIPQLDVLRSDEPIAPDLPKGNLLYGLGKFVTPAGITSTVLDIGTDPASFATLGLGGAIKGIGQGIRGAAQVRRAAGAGEEVAKGQYVVRNVYNPLIAKPEIGDAVDILGGGRLAASRHILKSAGSGFMDAHSRAISRIEARRALRGNKAALLSNAEDLAAEDLQVVFNKMDEVAEANIAKLKESTELSKKEVAEASAKIQDELSEAKQSLQKVWDEYPDFATREVVVGGLRQGAETTPAVPRITNPAIAQKLAAEKSLEGTAKTVPLVQTRKKMWLKNPEAVGALARELETAVLNGEEVVIGDLLKRLDPEDAAAVTKMYASPMGARERNARKAAKADEGTALGVTATGKQLTAADLRITDQSIKGTGQPKPDADFNPSKETLRVMSYMSDLSKRLNKPGSKNTPTKSLMSARELEDMFSTPKNINSIPVSVAWARLAYLVERAGNTEAPRFARIMKNKQDGVNPATEQGRHPLPSSFTVFGRKEEGKPFLSELLDAGRTINGTGYSQELVETLAQFGISVVKAVEDGHPILRTADEVQEILIQALAKSSVQAAERETLKVFNRLKRQYPALARESVESTLKPAELAALKEATARGAQIELDKLERLLKELNPADDVVGKAHKQLENNAIDWYGRGAAFNVLATGKMAFRGYGAMKSASLSDLSRVLKNVKVFSGGKPREMSGTEAFGRLYSEFKRISTESVLDPAQRKAAAEMAKWFEGVAQDPQMYSPKLINDTLGAARMELEGKIKDSLNSSNNFLSMFANKEGVVVKDWVINFGVDMYKASAKKGARDKGVFAAIVDERVMKVVRSRKDLTVEKGSPAYMKFVELTFRDWDGQGVLWDGAGMSTWNLLDIFQNTNKTNSKVLDPKERKILTSNIPAMVERVKERVWQFGLREERLSFPPDFNRKAFEEAIRTGTEPLNVGFKAGEFQTLRDNIGSFEYKLAGEALAAAKRLANIPELSVALNNFFSKLPVKNGVPMLNEAARKVLLTVGTKNPEALRLLGQIKVSFSNQFARQAQEFVENLRKTEVMGKALPEFANAAALENSIYKTGKAAVSHVMARLLLAENLMTADMAVKSLDVSVAKARRTTVDLVKERREWLADLDAYEKAATKATGIKPVKPSSAEVKKATLDDLTTGKYADNPLMLLAKIRSFTLDGSTKAAEEWDALLTQLLKTELPAGEFKSLKAITAEDLAKPAARGSLMRLAQALADNGDTALLKSLEKGTKPRMATIDANLQKLRSGLGLSPTELDEMVKVGNLADELDAAAADEVEELAASLAPDQIIEEEYTSTIDTLLRYYANTGDHHIPDITSAVVGRIAKKHIMWRTEGIRSFVSKLGKILDTNLPEGVRKIVDPESQFTAMRTVEPQAYLAGSKVAKAKLSDMAKAKGYELGTPERARFMRQNDMHIENLAQLALERLGMVFAMTVKEATGEASLLKLYGAESVKQLQEARPAALKTVYLSIFDVKQALPDELVERLFYAGKNESIPETTISGAVRLAVALRSELAAGKEFTQELNDGLANIMFDLIRAEIKKSTSIKEGTETGYNIYTHNKDLAEQKIAEFVDEILNPNVLDELVVAHIKNAAMVTKRGRARVENMLKPVLEKAAKAFKNPALGSGDRITAAINVFKEFEAVYNNKAYSEAFRRTARFDLHTFMVANMTKDDMNTFMASLYKQENLTGEAAAIAATQKASAKNADTVMMQSLKIEADSFEQAWDNSLGTNLIEAAKRGELDADMVAEAATTHATGLGHAMHAKKYRGAGLAERALLLADRTLERLFFGYGADFVIPLVNPLQRVAQEQVTNKTEHLAILANELDEIGATIEKRKKAWQIIQAIGREDEELLGLAAAHHVRVQMATAKLDTITVEEAKIAADAIDRLRPIFQELGENVEDEVMLEAVTRMSQHANEIFGGGIHSMMASAGLNARYIDEMVGEVGGGGVIPSFKAVAGQKDPVALTSAWKEETWNPDVDPLEMFRLMHAAFKHGQIIPLSAMTLTKTVGVPRSAYASAAEAQADGLSIMPRVDGVSEGQRLIYFLDTENYYYPTHLIPEIKQAAKTIDETTRIGKGAEWLQSLDRVQNRAKQFMTTLRPGNWNQNGLGGVTVNAFKGVWNPVRYGKAARMVTNNTVGGLAFIKQNNATALRNAGIDVRKSDEWGARYIKSMNEQGYTIKPASETDSGLVEVLVGTRRVNYKEQDIIEMYRRQGGFVTSTAVFDPIDETMRVGKALRGGLFKKITTPVGRWSANRDDVLRMALYLDIMKKQGGKNLEEASRNALREVNRVHPQPQDLSKFNQRWSKRTVMFFTWRAKTLGFLITEILDRPGTILAFQRAYTNTMLSQGLDVQLGDLEPKNVPMRSYMEGNMNVILPGFEDGLWSMSLANPVNDLFGSQGWLSGISLNTYEPIENQLLGWGTTTFKNVFASSDPLIVGLMVDWGFNQKTGQGTQFADSPDMVPLVVEDAFSRMGLKPLHTLLAYHMPDVFKRVSWEGKTQEDVDKASYLEWLNWLGGLRLKQVDKAEDQKKAVQELLKKIREYSNREVLKQQENLGG